MAEESMTKQYCTFTCMPLLNIQKCEYCFYLYEFV